MSFIHIEKFHTKPGKLIVAGLLVIGLFFGGLGWISATMPFSGAIVAPGVVKISNERQTVQHLEGGIVDKILVREGDRVTRGQVLIRLKSSQIDSSVEMIQGMLLDKMSEFDRLNAEKSMASSITWSKVLLEQQEDPEISKILKKDTEIFNSRNETFRSRIAINNARTRQLDEKISGANEELLTIAAIIDSLKEEISIKEPLVKEKYLDRSSLLLLNRQLEGYLGSIAVKKQSIAETKEKINEIRLASADLKNSFIEKAVAELGAVNEAVFELKEKLKPRKDAMERLEIMAPVAGEVINMLIHSENGGVIRAGQPILDIVPEGAKLFIECKLRQDYIDDVKEGQNTRIQLSAFNRVTTAPFEGEIVYVSPDTLEENTPAGPMSFYIIHALPLEGELEKNKVWLSSGMPAVCFILTQQRTFLEYLMEPILLNFDRALRETL